MKKREISDIEKEECKLLKQIFNDRKKELGLSQAKIAGLIGVTQAAINHYLNGTTFIYDGGSGVPLPDGAFIAGVVVEVKRRLIPTDILLSRLDPDYNTRQSKQR